MYRTDREDGTRLDPDIDLVTISGPSTVDDREGPDVRTHYHRIEERPFTADERSETTILVGNLTPKHETLLRAVFQRNGFRIASLPEPTKKSFRTGKEYCNNGVCNPVYYTAGTLIRYLKELEATGLSRDEIKEKYVYLTLSDCGPCRFGMYESEYRQALQNAGFDGFRVITTQLNKASRTGGKKPGLDFTTDQWFGIVNAIIVSDLLYGISYRLRPYEVHPGETNQAVDDCIVMLERFLRTRPHFELPDRVPVFIYRMLIRMPRLAKWVNAIGKFYDHFYGKDYGDVLNKCRDRLCHVPVDRTTPRPVAKIVGEFYSHLSESDANYKMFEFLEGEGAEVAVGSIGGVLLYWFYKSRRGFLERRGLDPLYPDIRGWQLVRRFRNWKAFIKKPLIFYLIDQVALWQYQRLNRALGGLARPLTPQPDLAKASASYYRVLTRGGEGHLEVAEAIHCTRHHECDMVLSLKPFGCMPSTQSDGVMATVVSHHDDMLFASIETTGDSDINAYSRVQMVLSDAQRRATLEFECALKSTGKRLEDIREFGVENPELLKPGFKVRRYPGIVGVSANYVLHVSKLMDRKKSIWGKLSCLVKANRGNSSLAWTSALRRSKQ